MMTKSNGPPAILLLSTYELGRPPLGIAAPLGALRAAGVRAAVADLSVQALPTQEAAAASFVAISTPMHTALRLGMTAARKVRELNPGVHICFHGLYAALHAQALLNAGLADSVVAGDDDESLLALATADPPIPGVYGGPGRRLPSPAAFDSLPPLSSYSQLVRPDGAQVLAGAVEATRGCKHVCRHCPVTPVWQGRFTALPVDAVLADVQSHVSRGAGHISFADPDFLNGPTHARRLAQALHGAYPELSWDFTAKVDHLLAARERGDLHRFAEQGAAFVITAVESFSDAVLDHLAKGHTRAEALALLADPAQPSPVPLRPTFVAFTPWTTRSDYCELFEIIEAGGLVDHVDPIQLTIRLLIPEGSALLSHPPTLPHLTGAGYDPQSLTYPWRHPDPGMDALHAAAMASIEANAAAYEPLRSLAT